MPSGPERQIYGCFQSCAGPKGRKGAQVQLCRRGFARGSGRLTCERTKPVALSAQYLPRVRVPRRVTVRACTRVSVRVFVGYGLCVCMRACEPARVRACASGKEGKGERRRTRCARSGWRRCPDGRPVINAACNAARDVARRDVGAPSPSRRVGVEGPAGLSEGYQYGFGG
jgi:hypothetical protein